MKKKYIYCLLLTAVLLLLPQCGKSSCLLELPVAVSADGHLIAAGSANNGLRLLDPKTGDDIRLIERDLGCIYSVIFSPDSKYVIAGCGDSKVHIFDTESGKPVLTLDGHHDIIYSVAISPNGRFIASASADNTIGLWNIVSGKMIKSIKREGFGLWDVSFSPDSSQIASGNADSTVDIWDAQSGDHIQKTKGELSKRIYDYFSWLGDPIKTALMKLFHASFDINFIAFSRDSKFIVLASGGGDIRIWDTKTKKLIRKFRKVRSITSMTISPDSKKIVIGGTPSWFGKASLVVFDITTGKRAKTITTETIEVKSVAFIPSEERIVLGSYGTIVAMDLKTERAVWKRVGEMK